MTKLAQYRPHNSVVDYENGDVYDPFSGDYLSFAGFDLQGRPIYIYYLSKQPIIASKDVCHEC